MLFPYVMHSVEELNLVSDLSNWGNCNIQFIGKLLDSDGVYICGGIEKNSSTIHIDFSLAAQIPPLNTIVRVWGELEMKIMGGQKVPLVKAKIARVIGSIDIPLYRKSLEIRREYTPHFAALKGKGLEH